MTLALCATMTPLGSPARATAASPDAKVVAMKAPMTVIGFDPEVAAANGYEIVNGKDGKRHSVKKEDTGGVVASGTVVDNCGSSYLRMYGTGGPILIDDGIHCKAWCNLLPLGSGHLRAPRGSITVGAAVSRTRPIGTVPWRPVWIVDSTAVS